jgi:hypothetical protein
MHKGGDKRGYLIAIVASIQPVFGRLDDSAIGFATSNESVF